MTLDELISEMMRFRALNDCGHMEVQAARGGVERIGIECDAVYPQGVIILRDKAST